MAGDLLFGLKFVKLSILPTLFTHFVQGRLGELRSGYLGLKELIEVTAQCGVCKVDIVKNQKGQPTKSSVIFHSTFSQRQIHHTDVSPTYILRRELTLSLLKTNLTKPRKLLNPEPSNET